MAREPFGRRYGQFLKQAGVLLKNPHLLKQLLEQFEQVYAKRRTIFAHLHEDFQLAKRYIGAYSRGVYPKAPWKSVSIAVLAILYFVNPFDAIPDFLIGAGLFDDLAVVAYCLSIIKEDLEGFARWEAQTEPQPNVAHDSELGTKHNT